MLSRAAILIGFLAFAGCTPRPPVDTAVMPQASGLADPANAIQYSAWAFALSSRTRGDPVSAARAVAALAFAAGAVNTQPAWRTFDPIIANELLGAREDVRRVLGVAPTATSQDVVNSMLMVASALAHHDAAAALTVLTSPIYTLGPEQTLAVLTNMPFIHLANVATNQAENALNGSACIFGCRRGGF